MLNISDNSINAFINLKEYKVFKTLSNRNISKFPIYTSLTLIFVGIIFLFLPWTQNINAKGHLTTRSPEQRPQAIQSAITGQLEKWFIKEGDYVNAGDTIIFLSEVKSEYLDPELIDRIEEQLNAKMSNITNYTSKAQSLENQYAALENAMHLKLEQTENKIYQARIKLKSDSLDLRAYLIDLEVAQNQFDRTDQLYDKGLKPLTELEAKRIKQQAMQAKVNTHRNKILHQIQEIQNLKLSLPTIESEYNDKLAKARSELFSALSSQQEAMATSAKLQNQLSNYQQRRKMYYVIAPQSGYITKSIKKGVGEIIKEGSDIATLMPGKYDLAMELYIRPRDLPLISLNNAVNLIFDGWPAITFSGWPGNSVGTFDGHIVAIDQFVSDNGEYRILVAPDNGEKPWPDQLRVGSGGRAFILLNDVPIWYEVWRQLNGFPPDFYQKEDGKVDKIKRKAPLKQLK